jgi:hypothetical protein
MTLEPFSLQTVERFIRFETSEVEKPKPAIVLLDVIPDPNYYETLQDLYTTIRAAFTKEMLIDVSGQYDLLQEYSVEPCRPCGIFFFFVRLGTGKAVPTTLGSGLICLVRFQEKPLFS